MILDTRGPTYGDHVRYHLPSVMLIRERWPSLNIATDTLSAITPGYYYLLASLSFLVGKGEISLRLINLFISSLVPALLLSYAKHSGLGARVAIVFLLPLLLSPSFVKNSIWIMTDNAALLLAVLSLLLIIDAPAGMGRSAVPIGILSSMATFFRQTNFWLVVPAAINLVLPTSSNDKVTRDAFFPEKILCTSKKKASPLLWTAFLLLPLLVVIILILSWGGPVPSRWSNASLSISICPIAYILAVFAVSGSGYVLAIANKSISYYLRLPLVRYFLATGFVVSLISPTSYNIGAGRWGGMFWEIVKLMPTLGERSILFMLLAPIGSAVIGILWHEMSRNNRKKESLIWISSVAAWSATFVVNRQVFHRYFEC